MGERSWSSRNLNHSRALMVISELSSYLHLCVIRYNESKKGNRSSLPDRESNLKNAKPSARHPSEIKFFVPPVTPIHEQTDRSSCYHAVYVVPEVVSQRKRSEESVASSD